MSKTGQNITVTQFQSTDRNMNNPPFNSSASHKHTLWQIFCFCFFSPPSVLSWIYNILWTASYKYSYLNYIVAYSTACCHLHDQSYTQQHAFVKNRITVLRCRPELLIFLILIFLWSSISVWTAENVLVWSNFCMKTQFFLHVLPWIYNVTACNWRNNNKLCWLKSVKMLHCNLEL